MLSKEARDRAIASLAGDEVEDEIAVDEDSPELDEAFFAKAEPASQVLPEILSADAAERLLRPMGRPKSAKPKQLVSLRLDQDIIEGFRATGDGWQSRINDALRRHLGVDSKR